MQTVYFYIDAKLLLSCSEDTLARLSQTRNRNTCDESDEVADMLPILLLSSKKTRLQDDIKAVGIIVSSIARVRARLTTLMS